MEFLVQLSNVSCGLILRWYPSICLEGQRKTSGPRRIISSRYQKHLPWGKNGQNKKTVTNLTQWRGLRIVSLSCPQIASPPSSEYLCVFRSGSFSLQPAWSIERIILVQYHKADVARRMFCSAHPLICTTAKNNIFRRTHSMSSVKSSGANFVKRKCYLIGKHLLLSSRYTNQDAKSQAKNSDAKLTLYGRAVTIWFICFDSQ
jgi:hypothetical protein